MEFAQKIQDESFILALADSQIIIYPRTSQGSRLLMKRQQNNTDQQYRLQKEEQQINDYVFPKDSYLVCSKSLIAPLV